MRGPSELLSMKNSSSSVRRFSRKRRNPREHEKYENERLPSADSSQSDPWRAENIRKSGPPSESDWWMNKDPPESNTKKSSSIFCPMPSLSTSKKSADSCATDSSNSSQNSSATREFQNCGFSMWKESRKKWRVQTVASRPSPPPPVNGDDVILGLTQVQRTFELPGRMKLSDAVELLVEIWECDRDY